MSAFVRTIPLPLPLKETLMIEVGGLCPVPRCGNQVWDFYPLDGNPNSINSENLLALCQKHFAMARAKTLSEQMLKTIRSLLQGSMTPKNSPTRDLSSRKDYLQEIISQIYQTGNELYLTYVGPLCLHPEWYFERREKTTMLPSMDRVVKEYIRSHSDKKYDTIRLIFRNTPRYIQKVNEAVLPDEHDKMVSAMLEEIDYVWGDSGDKGPVICCVDTGFFHIPLIFKEVAITSSRSSGNSPIEGGLINFDPGYTEWEKQNFKNVFDVSSRGQINELNALRTFVQNLWSA